MRRISCGGLLVFTFVLGAAIPAAHASDPFGVYARPTQVTLQMESGVRAKISGVIALATPDSWYSEPACGFVYYSCVSGGEALCREQFAEIAAAAAAGKCVGFSTRRDSRGVMYNNGTLHPLSATAGTPDIYDPAQGMGVKTFPCTGDMLAVPVLTVACDSSGADAGAGTGGAVGTGTGGAAAGTGGATSGTGGAASGTGGTVSGTGGVSGGGTGGSAVTPAEKSGGCSVAHGPTGGAALGAVGALALLLGVVLSRRRARQLGR